MDESLTVQVDIGLVAEMIAKDLSESHQMPRLLRVAEAAAALCAKLQTSLHYHDDWDDDGPCVGAQILDKDVRAMLPLISMLDASLRDLPVNASKPATLPCDQANIGGVRSTAGVRIAVDPYADLGTRGLR